MTNKFLRIAYVSVSEEGISQDEGEEDSEEEGGKEGAGVHCAVQAQVI